MTYSLIAYVVGHIAYHHLPTACFLYLLLACSLLVKKKRKLFIVFTFFITILGFIIDTAQHQPQSISATIPHTQTVNFHMTSLPQLKDGGFIVQAVSDSKVIQIKSKMKSPENLPDAYFILHHQCTLSGTMLPSQMPNQHPMLIVHQIDLNHCQFSAPTLIQRIQYLRNVVIERLLHTSLPGKGELIAIATGDTSALDKEMKTTAQRLGIAHLFAVSGTHISILMMMVYAVGKRLPVPLFIVNLFLLVLLPFFLVFVGASPSAIRAVAMTILTIILSKFCHFTSLQSLLIVYCLMSMLSSDYHYHLGFIYSFLISAILMLMKNVINQSALIKSLLYGSYISVVAAISINYLLINEIQWQGIISNLIFIPLYSFIVIPLSFIIALTAIIFPYLLNSFGFVLKLIFHVQNFIIHDLSFLNRFPLIIPDFGETGFLICVIITFILLYLLSLQKIKVSVILICCLCLAIWIIHPQYNNEMTLIDVGQGDAILFRSHTGETMLIDTGGVLQNHEHQTTVNITQKTLYPLFKKMGIRQIDYLVITHAHQDHMGELEHLATTINIKNIIINPEHFEESKRRMIQHAIALSHAQLFSYETISKIKLGDFQFNFFNTDITTSADPNEHSIVTLAHIYNTNILLMGDATTKNEIRLMHEYTLPTIQILKVGHHGSQTSSSAEFLQLTHPEIALISAGKNNIYHLPHPQTLKKLADVGSKVYNTADNHHIHIYFQQNSKHPYVITSQR